MRIACIACHSVGAGSQESTVAVSTGDQPKEGHGINADIMILIQGMSIYVYTCTCVHALVHRYIHESDAWAARRREQNVSDKPGDASRTAQRCVNCPGAPRLSSRGMDNNIGESVWNVCTCVSTPSG